MGVTQRVDETFTVLVKFFGGTSAVVRPGVGGGGGGVAAGRPTAVRVPLVAAVRPRRLVLDGREEIVHGVRDDHVVIGGHEERRDHAGQPGTCVANKNKIRVKVLVYGTTGPDNLGTEVLTAL